MNYKINYTITNGKKSYMFFSSFETAKEIYQALGYNLTIKKAKLFKIEDNKKILIEKFTKKYILTTDGMEI